MKPRPIFPTDGELPLNRLATSEDIIRLQNAANEDSALTAHEASWRGFTLRMAVRDVREAIFGIMSDLFGNTRPAPLWDVATKNHRLRGIGVILIVLAGSWLLIDAMS